MAKSEGKEGIFQFIKFAVVGVSNTAVDWIVYYVLINYLLGDHRSVSKALSFIAAMLNSYIWNSVWTFKKEYSKVGKNTSQKSAIFAKFAAVSLVGWGVNVLVFSLAAKNIGIEILDRDILPLVLASGAAVIWNFFANKFWTYKK